MVEQLPTAETISIIKPIEKVPCKVTPVENPLE